MIGILIYTKAYQLFDQCKMHTAGTSLIFTMAGYSMFTLMAEGNWGSERSHSGLDFQSPTINSKDLHFPSLILYEKALEQARWRGEQEQTRRHSFFLYTLWKPLLISIFYSPWYYGRQKLVKVTTLPPPHRLSEDWLPPMLLIICRCHVPQGCASWWLERSPCSLESPNPPVPGSGCTAAFYQVLRVMIGSFITLSFRQIKGCLFLLYHQWKH